MKLRCLWWGAMVCFCVLVWRAPGQTQRPEEARTNLLAVLQTTSAVPVAVTLHRTPAAPVGATGEIQFEPAKRRLHLKLKGLAPGKYAVRFTRASDGGSFRLGSIIVTDPDKTPDTQANDNSRQDSAAHVSNILQTESELELPRDLNVADISEISVADYGGTVLLDSAAEPRPASAGYRP